MKLPLIFIFLPKLLALDMQKTSIPLYRRNDILRMNGGGIKFLSQPTLVNSVAAVGAIQVFTIVIVKQIFHSYVNFSQVH